MTATLKGNTITLSGACGVEEVETLIGYLEGQPEMHVDLSAATAIHTTLWQALMVFRPTIKFPASSSSEDRIVHALRAYFTENPNIA